MNDRLDDSIDALKAIILTERLRAAGREPSRADEQKLVEAGGEPQAGARAASLGPDSGKLSKDDRVIHRGYEVDLYSGFDSNYRYILVAARRARQLQSGASPLVATDSTKPCRIAAAGAAGRQGEVGDHAAEGGCSARFGVRRSLDRGCRSHIRRKADVGHPTDIQADCGGSCRRRDFCACRIETKEAKYFT